MRQLAVAAVIMLALDSMYLGATRSFWGNIIKTIQDQKLHVRYLAAAGVYLMLLLGLDLFVLKNGANPLDGLLLGIVIYGVYELTNYAIFDRWPIEAVFLDTIWGGLMMATTTYVVKKLNY
jgi:uncharacterized membrane protein